MKLENKEICASCGGKCCKKSGCDYFISDFDSLTREGLYNVLQSGNISIVAALKPERLRTGKMIFTPYLYLRARNKDRDIVDLFSFKKTCSMLTETGCSYDINNRPSGGVNLIPNEKGLCSHNVDPVEELKKWEPYQNILSRLVKRITGKSVDTLFRENVEEVFTTILREEFDGIAESEIVDMLSSLNDLIECFPLEFKSAREKSKQKVKVISPSNK